MRRANEDGPVSGVRSADAPRLERLMSRARVRTGVLIRRGLEAAPVRPERGVQAGGTELVRVAFDLRGRSAGQMRVDGGGHCVIRYNPLLLLRYGDAFLERTVPHEVAHYLAYRRFGRTIRPHGVEWRGIMQQLGAAPTRCHDYDVTGLAARRLRYFDYHCGCADHRLSSIRHNKVADGRRYLCRRCGEVLRPGSRPCD